MVALLVLLTIVAFLTADYLVQRQAQRKRARFGVCDAPAPVEEAFDPGRIPADVFLAPGHTWLRLRPSGAVALGVDRLPLTLLGGLDKLDVLSRGTTVQRGDVVAVLRRGDRELKLRSPLDGTIESVNEDWRTEREEIARDPFVRGWIYAMQPANLAPALRRTFVAEEATTWLRNQLRELRDFVVGLPAPAPVTLTDGGLPAEGLATRLDDEAWDRLVQRFFPADTAGND